MIYALIGVLIGVLLPHQSAINHRLLASVSTPWVMSAISFLVGTACLLVLTCATVGTVLMPPLLLTTQPVWLWSGGLLGVIGMTTTVLLLPRIGSLYSTALNLTAQVITTMIVDHFGFFSVEVHPAGAWRISGALIVIGAAILAVLAGRAHPRRRTRNFSTGWYVIALGIGGCFGLQVVINGRLAQVLDSALHSALVSFTVGTLALLFLVVATRSSVRVRIPAGQLRNPWWMWTGGMLGALYVAGVAFLAPLLGSAVTVVVMQLGLLAGSLAVDHFGLLSAPKKSVRPLQVVGLMMMAGGVIVMNAPEILA